MAPQNGNGRSQRALQVACANRMCARSGSQPRTAAIAGAGKKESPGCRAAVRADSEHHAAGVVEEKDRLSGPFFGRLCEETHRSIFRNETVRGRPSDECAENE